MYIRVSQFHYYINIAYFSSNTHIELKNKRRLNKGKKKNQLSVDHYKVASAPRNIFLGSFFFCIRDIICINIFWTVYFGDYAGQTPNIITNFSHTTILSRKWTARVIDGSSVTLLRWKSAFHCYCGDERSFFAPPQNVKIAVQRSRGYVSKYLCADHFLSY